MIYAWDGVRSFDGGADFIDISDELHRLLQADACSVDVAFRTEDAGYQPLFAVYYKESVLPDFALALQKGRPSLILRREGGLTVRTGGEACCDGARHTLSFRGGDTGVRVWLDGALVIEDAAPPGACFEPRFLKLLSDIGARLDLDMYIN